MHRLYFALPFFASPFFSLGPSPPSLMCPSTTKNSNNDGILINNNNIFFSLTAP